MCQYGPFSDLVSTMCKMGTIRVRASDRWTVRNTGVCKIGAKVSTLIC